MDVEDILEHHGIKGQRWGTRHKPNPKTGRVSSDFKTSAELRKKPIPALTNKQLKTANERANLEQNFSRLNPSRAEIGKKRVKAILATAGVTSVAGFLNSPNGKATVSAGQKFSKIAISKIGNFGKSELVKRSARFAVKQRIKNL